MILRDRAEFVNKILADVYKKKPRWYEVLNLIFIEDKTYPEAAEIMGISLGALNVMLHRIRKWIKKHYQNEFEHLDKI